jgi:hypothetical protein
MPKICPKTFQPKFHKMGTLSSTARRRFDRACDTTPSDIRPLLEVFAVAAGSGSAWPRLRSRPEERSPECASLPLLLPDS